MQKQNIRKIIKIEYSRLVSLPLFWLALVGLDTGDYVKFSIGRNNKLEIVPYRVDENETT